ncbi:unnamed protein product [Rotaria magnacalcarata]|uniref:Glucose-methanol-choline oxidoreductase N-terminal domain-containing protein n=1 Tax=Rotaria magnacalcarata TaxID=392030 RepID=A0A816N553_9BILA|nr:unnamed protein product [Rotaria magnacalcarata]CAF4449139.1 unnamed protein product [Rotaria magnacalcarata]
MFSSVWTVVFLINALCFQYVIGSRTNVRNRPSVRRTTKLPSTFDYIVLGGGTGGSVVANRLSASGHYNVLLLEEGTNVEDDPMVSIPYNWDITVGSSLDSRGGPLTLILY